jgi:hypothetical protein
LDIAVAFPDEALEIRAIRVWQELLGGETP